MKILIINQHKDDFLGGSEVQCDIIAKYLKKFGHEVVYYAVNAQKKNYQVPYNVFPAKNLNTFSFFNNVKKIDPEIIYWRLDRRNLFLSALVANFFKIKFVFSVAHIKNLQVFSFKRGVSSLHDLVKIIASNIKRFFGAINYLGLRFVDGAVVNNNDFKKLIPSYINRKITVRNSIELTLCQNQFKWSKPFILWVANIKKTKNPEKYIKLARRFEASSVDFLMVGAIQAQKYEKILADDNLPDNFYYLGPKSFSEVNSMLKKSLFLAHTCSPEGFPNIFIQAWLAGKPTVTLHFDPEGVIEQKNIGYYSKNFNKFTDDVGLLLEDSQKRRKMGEKARVFAQKSFNPEVNIKKLETFLKKI